jgi:formate hydrogenlyase subunit 3/multisubunit Na+/H+ antiporter MnhD subunit
MTPLAGALAAVGVLVASGALALVSGGRERVATQIAVVGAAGAGALGLVAAILAMGRGTGEEIAFTWHVPAGAFVIGLDALSGFFLVPLFVLGSLAAVYGRTYLGGHAAGRSAARAAAAFNFLLAAVALVLLARHALVFLFAYEVMTLLAYLLVTHEHHELSVRRAGWTYLIASHLAMMALFALFLVMGDPARGVLDFGSFAALHAAPVGTATTIFLLALLGFGTKAGVVGLHVWLPEAHAAAPSHVSALMSGVLVNVGLYGLLRVVLFLPPVAGFGAALMGLGLAGAVVGIALALYQRDMKRVLAYSSVENVGIVLTGLGLGLWARASGEPTLAAFGFAGALLHLWNHTAMKGLLFLAAGSILRSTGSKDLERLGGLLRRMRWTGTAFVLAAVAIAALPPLSGFVSEWLLYRGLAAVGLHHGGMSGLAALVGVATLALVGGLTALCFVRLVGIVLLGQPRSEAAAGALESPPAMTVPMALLGLVLLALSFAPGVFVAAQGPLLAQLVGGEGQGAAGIAGAALEPVVATNLALLAALLLVGAIVSRLVRGAARDETWACGYAAPGPRMQYTGRSFSELLTERLLPRWLRPRPRVAPPEGPFPGPSRLDTDAADPFTRGAYEPVLVRLADQFARLHWLQRGSLHMYLVYILAVTVLALAWAAARDLWWLP